MPAPQKTAIQQEFSAAIPPDKLRINALHKNKLQENFGRKIYYIY